MGVVGVEHRQPIGNQPLDDLAFRLRDALDGAEFAEMGASDLEHDGDVRRGDRGQARNLSDMARSHLGDEEARVPADLQRGQRKADLVVERADGRHGGAERGQQGGHEVLGGGLAHRAGDADQGERRSGRTPSGDVRLREQAQRVDRIGNDYLRHRRIHFMLYERHDRAGFAGASDEIMTVHTLAGDRHEHGAFTDLARIADRRRGQCIGSVFDAVARLRTISLP